MVVRLLPSMGWGVGASVTRSRAHPTVLDLDSSGTTDPRGGPLRPPLPSGFRCSTWTARHRASVAVARAGEDGTARFAGSRCAAGGWGPSPQDLVATCASYHKPWGPQPIFRARSNFRFKCL